jgi:hypothetical protein
MSDDDDDQVDSDANLFDGSLDGPDSMGFGPLIPTETERSLMERVRQELKHELKQVIEGIVNCQVLFHLQRYQLVFSFFIGLQGEDCRHKGGNFTQEKSRKASWGHHLCLKSLVANTFQVAIPYCKFCLIRSSQGIVLNLLI